MRFALSKVVMDGIIKYAIYFNKPSTLYIMVDTESQELQVVNLTSKTNKKKKSFKNLKNKGK
jgi:hypothetical protein